MVTTTTTLQKQLAETEAAKGAEYVTELLADIKSRSVEMMYKEYDEMLDDCYDLVKVAGYEYETSRVLKEVDPIAYRCGFLDWVNSLEDEWVQYGDYYYDAEQLEAAFAALEAEAEVEKEVAA